MDPQTAILPDGREITLIHFVFQSPRGVVDGDALVPTVELTWKIACAPNLLEMASTERRAVPYQRTDDPRAVNCPLCMDSQQFKTAMRPYGRKRR